MRSGPNTRQKAPPLLGSLEAKDKLEVAARAAGMTMQQLADLVFESGIVPPPAKDGITQRYTLKDLGERMWASMQGTPKDERAAWFQGLIPVQRTATIVVLRDNGYRTEVIARELGIQPAEVMRIWNAYGSELGAQVVGLRLDTIAGQLQLASERAQQMAVDADDHAAYWRIEKEKVAVMQSLGIVDQAIRKVQITHKLDDEQKQELERLASLRNKQERRRIEIEELTVKDEQGDELPEELKEDYDE